MLQWNLCGCFQEIYFKVEDCCQ